MDRRRDRSTEIGDGTRWPGERPIESITFIVRVSRDDVGGLTGIIEHARTGRKERFEGLQAIVAVIGARMPVQQPTDLGTAT